MNTLLWVVFPYICLTIFVVGHLWRYKYDKFGWTTRSSQLYEDRLLRWGSPMFHFGILFVVMGHIMGLLVPKSWTDAVGISQSVYHFLALSVGLLAGFLTLVGMAILIYRRRTTGPVFSATTPMDKVMYAFLVVVILLGLANTLGWHAPGINNLGGPAEHQLSGHGTEPGCAASGSYPLRRRDLRGADAHVQRPDRAAHAVAVVHAAAAVDDQRQV